MVEQCFSTLWPVKYKDKLDNVMNSILFTRKYTLLHELACNIASYCTSGRGIFTSHR